MTYGQEIIFVIEFYSIEHGDRLDFFHSKILFTNAHPIQMETTIVPVKINYYSMPEGDGHSLIFTQQ